MRKSKIICHSPIIPSLIETRNISFNVIKLEIYIERRLSLKHGFPWFQDSSGLVGFSGFLFWFGFSSIFSSVTGRSISVSCKLEYFTRAFTRNICCCTKNSYKICFDIFPITFLLNQKRFYEKRSQLNTSFKKNLNLRKKNPITFMGEKYWRYTVPICIYL